MRAATTQASIPVMDAAGASRAALERDEVEARWAAWMTGARGGDAEAYRLLLAEIAHSVEHYLRGRFGDSDLVEDAVQESLLAVHRARDSWDPKRRFRPWLFTIVRHKAIDLLRRRGVRARVGADHEAIEAAADPTATAPLERLEAAALLRALEPKYREALVLTKLEGRSIEDAADAAGCSPSAMKTRVHRAIRAARRLLDLEEVP